MSKSCLEHVNITVSDVKRTTEMLCNIFDWKVRWEGEAIHKGYTAHVGSDNSYVAIYSGVSPTAPSDVSYDMIGGLNHIAVVVDDLDAVEKRVVDEGFTTHSHADYEPGRRFYFRDHDNIEIEVVSYE